MALNMNDENIVVSNGVLVGVKNKDITKITLPEGVESIKVWAFYKCSSLAEITLPEGLKSIGAWAFEGCRSLKKITLPEGLKSIGDGAFYNCSSLTDISLPEGLKSISHAAFQDCSSLTDIIIPEGVESIGRDAFNGCESLKKITLPEGLESISEVAFRNCSSLIEIILPEGLKSIGSWAFRRCSSLKKIKIIIDEDRELSFMQKRKIISKIKKMIKKSESKLPINVEFELITKDQLTDHKIIAPEHQDDDIQAAIDKIADICANLPENNSKVIMDKVNKLLKEYEENKEDLEPHYGKKKKLQLNPDVRVTKEILLNKLDAIYLNLSSENKLIDSIKTLDEYKKLISLDIKELSDENNLEGQIKNIIYLTSILDEKRRNDIIKKLNEIINKASSEASNVLTEITSGNILFRDTIFNYETELKVNISKLYDEVKLISDKIKPYRELLDVLSDKEINNDNNEMAKDISTIKLVFLKLTNSKYKDELQEKFSNIAKKYQEILTNIISDAEALESAKYKNIEKELRQELKPLLELINNYAYLDTYTATSANKTNLHNQIKKSIDIINNGNYYELDKEDYEHEVITSFVIDILSIYQENDDIPEEERKGIKEDLLNVLNQWSNELESNTIDTLEEYNEIISAILKDLAKIKIDTEIYIDKLSEYNKNIK